MMKAMSQTSLRLESGGRLSLPADIRQEMGLQEGDALVLRREGNRLILEAEAALLKQLYEAVGTSSADSLASAELIRERREEAAKE
jgi:AbrB family looped-hinge helix DNA binding protein